MNSGTSALYVALYALATEGPRFHASHVRPKSVYAWFKNRAVFGDTGYPWTAPEYQGDPDRLMPLPNFEAMDRFLCLMSYHETLAGKDVTDIVATFEKVDHMYGTGA